jgi:hypothetical protein
LIGCFSCPVKRQPISRTYGTLWGTAKTWREFRNQMPTDEYEDYMVRSFDDNDRPRPEDGAPFKATDEGWDDGEWPTNPIYWMDSYLPGSVMALGTPIKNVFGGSWIYASYESEALKFSKKRVTKSNETTSS